ncbi:MAG: phosphatase [Phycisphaerales bacterium]|nr:MAG: phosphatase [Phycisphaerales bacterium]
MFAYRQTFEFRGQRYQRSGMACTVETRPFGPREGGGILPHEQTFSGPKQDRFALMEASKAQFSPIFGLHADEDQSATNLLHEVMASRPADMTADMGDGVLHEVWTIDDQETINAYQRALEGEDVFIADGHHRYTTAVNYLAKLEESGQQIGPDHPARRTMIVLVGMSDPGLAIGPTHRVLGGMAHYDFAGLTSELDRYFTLDNVGRDPSQIESQMAKREAGDRNVLGLIDLASNQCLVLTAKSEDPLAESFPSKPKAWRTLDVSLVQYLIVEKICEPKFNDGQPVKWAFPHSVEEVLEIASGQETGAGGGAGFAQVAVIVRPTPLEAVKAIGAAGELMPQKSTFFYPKLATGLFIHPLSELVAASAT